MKRCAPLVAALAASASAFAPSSLSTGKNAGGILAAATLEQAPKAEEDGAPATPPPIPAVVAGTETEEKAWPVDKDNFVKESERIQP